MTESSRGILGFLGRFKATHAPPPAHIVLIDIDDPDIEPETDDFDEDGDDPQPISAFTCIIEYGGDMRMITGRRYDIIGELGYVGAICHQAKGYRQFRCDRIEAVIDALTGEVLGDGDYFQRFAPASVRERAPDWGLSHSRRALLTAGLNILAFIARCDGHWHPLESEAIERFIISMWLRKEWEGDPPIDTILAHAERLSPDARSVMTALKYFVNSQGSRAILRAAISDLIAADGRICADETEWVIEIDTHLDDLRRRTMIGEGA